MIVQTKKSNKIFLIEVEILHILLLGKESEGQSSSRIEIR